MPEAGSRSEGRTSPQPPRIGLVVPAGSLLDHEYWELADGDARLYFARLDHLAGSMARDRSIALGSPELLVPAVRRVLAVDPDVVAFACTAASFAGGEHGEAEIRRTMLSAGAPKVVTTARALRLALASLDLSTIAVATPYTRELTRALTDYLEGGGVAVVSTHARGMEDPARVSDLGTSAVAAMAAAADDPRAQAVFLSCTNLPTIESLGPLTRDLGKPVLSSNQVTLWAALVAAGAERAAHRVLHRLGRDGPGRGTRLRRSGTPGAP